MCGGDDVMKKMKTNKITALLNDRNKDIIETLANSSDTSFSTVLNCIITALCDAPRDIRNSITEVLMNKQEAYKQSIPDSPYITKTELWHKLDICQMLCKYINAGEFTDDVARERKEKSHNNLIKIKIKDGYAVFPDDWAQLNPEDAENCSYVVIIEVSPRKPYILNGEIPPHFVYYAKYNHHNVDDKFYSHIDDLCVQKYPPFKKLIDDRIHIDEENKLSLDELKKRTIIGYFYLYVEGEDSRSTIDNYDPPYGAKIIRS